MICILVVLLATAMHASNKTGESTYFKRGIYISMDFSFGPVLNERIADRYRNSSYGTDIAVGYRFLPQLAVAVGTGAHAFSNRTLTCNDTVLRQVENTSVPIFFTLRSDFRDKEVCPYIQANVGYSFVEMYTRDDSGRVQYAKDRFTNGRYEYIGMDDSYIQYGMAGWFTSIDLGIGLHVIGRSRMNVALSVGAHQSFLGTSYAVPEGTTLNFGRVDYLITDSEPPIRVRTVGGPDFKDSIEASVKIKIGFSF